MSLKMKRRKFIKSTAASLLGLPLALNGMNLSPIRKSALLDALNPDSDRVLVLVQLIGGNDGLNMLVPLDYYDTLANVRPNVILPENSLESIGFDLAFHPVMTGARSLFDNAKLGIVQGVAYPDQNRSHFRSTDIWTSASPAAQDWTTGWLGRKLDMEHSTYPVDYPNSENPDPLAIAMGTSVSLTCQGEVGNFSMTLTDPFNLGQLAAGGDDFIPEGLYGDQLEFVRLTIEQTNAYSERIVDIANQGTNTVDYPETDLAQQLKTIALMLSGGSQTRIFVAKIGGFDTHASQVVEGDTSLGSHAELLLELSDAIQAFQSDIEGLGLSERVLGLTFSEFGRRIRSNDSFGTDHGTAAPLMLFGDCVNAGVFGDNAEILPDVGTGDGVAMQFDFRDIYGTILQDWFELEESTVKELIHEDYIHLPILQDCSDDPVSTSTVLDLDMDLSLFPNPARDYVYAEFRSEDERVALTVFDAEGRLMEQVMDRSLTAGSHRIRIDISTYPPGNYFVRIVTKGLRQKAKVFVKV